MGVRRTRLGAADHGSLPWTCQGDAPLGVRQHLPIGPIQTGGLGRSSLLKHALFLQALGPKLFCV